MARVLVVDDDQDILKIADKLLISAGYDVFTAQDALQAMEIMNSIHIDCIISDANMPTYSGFDLVQTIRNNKHFANVAIAMLTGRREKKDIEKAIRMGVDEYIVKPIDPMLFLKKVESLFNKKPSEDHSEIVFSSDTTLNQASIVASAHVISISEVGMVIKTENKLKDNEVIELDSNLFNEIGIKKPALRVLFVQKLDENTWQIKLAFLGVGETFLQKLRGWIYQRATSMRQAS